MIRCVRTWTGEDGDSLFEEGWIDLAEGCVAIRGQREQLAVLLERLHRQPAAGA